MTRKARTDVFPPEKRSEIMRAVKSVDTKPEIALRKALHARGFRYRLYAQHLPGKPDLVFARWRAVIFVHGCFWHGHTCARGRRVPKTNRAYWTAKIARNKARDAAVANALTAAGWRVRVVWECELKDLDAAADRASAFLRGA